MLSWDQKMLIQEHVALGEIGLCSILTSQHCFNQWHEFGAGLTVGQTVFENGLFLQFHW